MSSSSPACSSGRTPDSVRIMSLPWVVTTNPSGVGSCRMFLTVARFAKLAAAIQFSGPLFVEPEVSA